MELISSSRSHCFWNWTSILPFFLLLKGSFVSTSTYYNLTATSSSAELVSQNYPNKYPNSSIYYWLISTSDKTAKITLTVTDCMIEYDDACQHDFVKVYDGPNDSFLRIGVFCGDTQPSFQSTKNTIFIKFKTDSSKQYRGFKIEYKSISSEDAGINFSTKALVCTVMGLLCTFLLFILGNYFLRTARKTGRGPASRLRAPSVVYSITNTGQTIVSIENGTRIQRSSSGHIVRDADVDNAEETSLPQGVTNFSLPQNISDFGGSAEGFSMVLNVQGLRLTPPSYESVEQTDRENANKFLSDPPPAYDSLDSSVN
ncbi:hypothetical protein SNE40_021556 [Patella caerulea]|uniref:CUB domain-containing protein n=1 Tax=Patella caerulea TaxID=87958 RepID=A0AAN8G4B4_PATCE